MNQSKKAKESAEARLVATFGDCDGAHSRLGDLTYLKYQRSGYTVGPTEYPQLKLLKGKK
jgi:hypothetical protein